MNRSRVEGFNLFPQRKLAGSAPVDPIPSKGKTTYELSKVAPQFDNFYERMIEADEPCRKFE